MSELTERIAAGDAESQELAMKKYWNARSRARGQPLLYPEIEEAQINDPAISVLVSELASDIVTLHGCSVHYAFVLIAKEAGTLAKRVSA